MGTTKPAGTSFTIAHLSDPHLSRQYYREHIKSFKILLRTILDHGCDHLVITGDIVSTGDPDDYYLARTILTTFGLMDSKRLTIVPGNHDVFGGPHRAVDVLSFPRYIRTVDYHRRLALFEEAFAETFVGAKQLNSGNLFPFVERSGSLCHHRFKFHPAVVLMGQSARFKRDAERRPNCPPSCNYRNAKSWGERYRLSQFIIISTI